VILIFFGNPLIDFSVNVDDLNLFTKYGLLVGSECTLLSHSKKLQLFEELRSNYSCSSTIGGSSLNSARATNWRLQQIGKQNQVLYVGAIGDDQLGDVIKSGIEKENLLSHLQVLNKEQTGVCFSLVKNKERTLVAIPGASRLLKKSFSLLSIQATLKQKNIIYFPFFFVSNKEKMDCILSAIENQPETDENHFKVATNLSSANWLKENWLVMKNLLAFIDIILGNDNELKEVAKLENWDIDDLQYCQMKLAKMLKPNGIVVTTRGEKSTLVTTANSDFYSFEVDRVPKEEIVDTNGAGDAFVGGFLALFSRGRELKDCIIEGHNAAGKIIRVTGFDLGY